MKSQTERPVKQRSTRSNKSRKYNRQTAHVEARRDGKPLIFGWGKHLSHVEKVRIQRRATWAIAGLFGFPAIVKTLIIEYSQHILVGCLTRKEASRAWHRCNN